MLTCARPVCATPRRTSEPPCRMTELPIFMKFTNGRVLAGREDAVGEGADLAAGDVVNAHLHATGLRHAQAPERAALSHDRVADLHEVHERAVALRGFKGGP